MHPRWAELVLTLGFFTRLPVGRSLSPLPALSASAWALPLAGLVVAAPGAVLLAVAPGALGAILAVSLAVWISGGLHEDGLADLADGMGGREPASRLEIMRNSRIGAYGVLALGLVTALRIAALAALPFAGAAFLALAMLSRAGVALLMTLPPARRDGLGAGVGRPSAPVLGAGAALALAGAVLALGPGPALLALAGMALAQGGVALLALRRLGGQTGDVLGAAQQAGEAAGLVALALAFG